MLREERMFEIIDELEPIKDFVLEKKIEFLVNYLRAKIVNTNCCYRITPFDLSARGIIDQDELLEFKHFLVSSLKEVGLEVEEEEGEDAIKVECCNKTKVDELPRLSPLQTKIIEFYTVHENADEVARQLIEKGKLTQQEYNELQLVRHYEN